MSLKIKRFAALVLAGALAAGAFGCGAQRYRVDYCGQRSSFKGAKDSYRAGQIVHLEYDMIATDTSYTFYVDGEAFSPKYSDRAGYILEFPMPDHDIEVRCEWRNDMIYTPGDGD